MHYLLIYDLCADYMERRPAFRSEHLRLAWGACERGELMLAGAIGEPAEGAVLWFKCDDPGAVERFANADPYVRNGLVTRWRVVPWNTVVGFDAVNPTRVD